MLHIWHQICILLASSEGWLLPESDAPQINVHCCARLWVVGWEQTALPLVVWHNPGLAIWWSGMLHHYGTECPACQNISVSTASCNMSCNMFLDITRRPSLLGAVPSLPSATAPDDQVGRGQCHIVMWLLSGTGRKHISDSISDIGAFMKNQKPKNNRVK